MKVAVAGGHSKKAPGAAKYLNEYKEDRAVAKALVNALKDRGCSVVNCSNEKATVNGELAEECRLANKSKSDLFCAIHFNASAGATTSKLGVEVWYYAGDAKGKKHAANVSKKLATLMGLPNRGAKATRDLYVLNSTDMTAILVEVCFVNSKADAAAYNKVGAAKVADTIAAALVGAKKTTPATTKPPTTFKPYRVKVACDVLNVRKGAGSNTQIMGTVKKGEVYTIIAERKSGSLTWLKLKSGAGYICSKYTSKV